MLTESEFNMTQGDLRRFSFSLKNPTKITDALQEDLQALPSMFPL
jgi:hypothetical protein